jgi:TRAP-type C4-dicarboxylate transport system permease small subunit
MPDNSSLLNNLLRSLHRIEDGVLAFILLSMILIASSQIFLRNLFESGLVWADPLLRMMVLWLGLLGALAATRENRHIRIDLLKRFLSLKVRVFVRIFNNLFSALVVSVLAYHSMRFVMMEYDAGSVVFLNIPAWIPQLILPFGFAFMSVRFLIHFVIGIQLVVSGRYKQ